MWSTKAVKCFMRQLIFIPYKTRIKVDEERIIEIEINNGIRQGCAGSNTLFKLLTYIILKKIEGKAEGYKDEQIRVNLLFYADDGILLAAFREEAQKNI